MRLFGQYGLEVIDDILPYFRQLARDSAPAARAWPPPPNDWAMAAKLMAVGGWGIIGFCYIAQAEACGSGALMQAAYGARVAA